MLACGSQRRIEPGASGCCDIVRVRCLPVSGWYGLEVGGRCATGCRGRVRLVGFITEPATARQILEHFGEPTIAPAIAPARAPPVEVNGQYLIAPEAVEAIPELEFDQTANLTAEGGHDRLVADGGADAEPTPDLEFDQTLRL